MSRPRGSYHIETWAGGGIWHWLVKNLFQEIVDCGEAKKKREAEQFARESRNRHAEAAANVVAVKSTIGAHTKTITGGKLKPWKRIAW